MVKRDEHGRFIDGSVANPGGRPKGCAKALQDIQSAVEEFEREKGVSYWKAATLIAMKLANEGNTSLLAKILDKFVSSKIDMKGEGFGSETRILIIRPEKKEEVGSRIQAPAIPG